MAALKHARRGSYEYEDLPSTSEPVLTPPTPSGASHQRHRVLSNPSPGVHPAIQSAGPYRTSFNIGTSNSHTRSGSINANSLNYAQEIISSPSERSSSSSTPIANGAYGPPAARHSRSASATSEFSNPSLRSSFAYAQMSDMASWKASLYENGGNGTASPPPSSNVQPSPASSRRHSRIHSRNLSIFFPRPGTTTVHSIAEDGAQEIEAPVADIPSTSPTLHSVYSMTTPSPSPTPPPPRSQLGRGFKFGGRPPPSASSTPTNRSQDRLPSIDLTLDSSSASSDNQPSSVPMSKTNTGATHQTQTSSRRGHHHRHSLSHSFFSFMEPQPSMGVSPHGHARKQSNLSISVASPSPPPGPTPVTAATNGSWGPLSPFSATSTAFPPAQLLPPKRTVSLQPSTLPAPSTQRSSTMINKILALPDHMKKGLAFGAFEGFVGCTLWIMGHNIESLACCGLAYWVVFDAVGTCLGVYGRSVDDGAGIGSLRLPYGAKRTEVVALFAQSVYLLFSAVYICKETLEHALLSTGDEGHHHHHSQGATLNTGLNYPLTFLWLSFISLSLSSALLKSNIKILDATGLYIPSYRQLLRTLFPSSTSFAGSIPTRPSSYHLLTNPYTLFPLLITSLLLSTTLLPLDQELQRTADMLVAALLAAGTAWLSWPACLTLGKVLLQMAPERSEDKRTALTEKGTMEALLRAMKEIERHPQVLHLPAPHIWQISPPSTYLNTRSYWEGKVKYDPPLRVSNGHSRSLSVSANAQHLRRRAGGIGGVGGKGGGIVVVTVELHVKKTLEDVECLELTRWAWQKCINALGQGDEGVTVGIVRG